MSEGNINFLDSPSVTWTVVDDPTNDRFDIQASAAVTLPHDSEQLFTPGGGVVVAPGGAQNLTWAKSSGANLLDLTIPGQPVVVAAGIYGITVSIQASSVLTAGVGYNVVMHAASTLTQQFSSPPPTAKIPNPNVTACLVHYFNAGDSLTISVSNPDAVAHSFILFSAVVQRIS